MLQQVNVTSTVDYEVGNVSKCLKAGFVRIAIVGMSEDKLKKISSAVTNSLGGEKASSVSYHLPDDFIALLGSLPADSEESEPKARTRGGRVIRSKRVRPLPEEARAKEEEALVLMADIMKARERPEPER